jgi:hypothetical protein
MWFAATPDLRVMSEQIVREPRWPAFVAMLASACLYWALPEPLSVGPGSNYRGYYDVARALVFAANGIITAAMIASLALLIEGLPQHAEPPKTLLRSATALWITNVLVFRWHDAAGADFSHDRRVARSPRGKHPLSNLPAHRGFASESSGSLSRTPDSVDFLVYRRRTHTPVIPNSRDLCGDLSSFWTRIQNEWRAS